MEARLPYGYYRHLFSQTDVDNSLYGYVKSDMEEHRLSYALSGNWQRSDPNLGKDYTHILFKQYVSSFCYEMSRFKPPPQMLDYVHTRPFSSVFTTVKMKTL